MTRTHSTKRFHGLGVISAVVTVVSVVLSVLPDAASGQTPTIYTDPRQPVDARVRDLLGRMTPEEKFWQMFMLNGAIGDSGTDYSKGVFGLQFRGSRNASEDAAATNRMQRFLRDSTRLGIPMLPFEEAVHGLMRNGSAVYPAAIGLAASFDTTLMSRVASTMAREARARGIRQVLSPVLNIATDVRWGRVEETYGEDPYLSTLMGRAFVREFERRGVVTTPKHFVANVGEGGRDSYPIDVSRRHLEELHFPAFKSAIRDAGARSIMMSYNSIDGLPASQNGPLMNGTLKRDWGFGGFIISDQSAVGGATVLHRTEASTTTATKRAIEGGLDVIFQAAWREHRPYLSAFLGGSIDQRAIDAAVARVLRAKFQLGLFEDPFVSIDSAKAWDSYMRNAPLAREAERAAIVLLRNTGVLPLKTPARIALIGSDAVAASQAGGYWHDVRLGGYTMDNASGIPLASALVARLGSDRVRVAWGPNRGEQSMYTASREAFDSLRGEYFANPRLEGAPAFVRSDANIDFRWTLNSPGRGVPFDWYSVRWTGRLIAPPLGTRKIGVEANDGYRLWIDGTLVIDNWRRESFRATIRDVALSPGPHDFRLEYFETTGNARIRFLVGYDRRTWVDSTIAEAVEAARQSDVAIIATGYEEGEFRDRSSLALPGAQEELIQRVAATGTPVIVLLYGGSAVTMSRWIDRVAAVVHVWYPGQEGGNAIADVLLGDANPAGRLPVTFPMSEGQLPLVYNHKPTGRGDDYVDGTGQPLFPFGHGLSYTTFEYSALRMDPAEITATGRTTVRLRVKNSGTRAGDEVVQLYVHDVLASVARPVMELMGFTRIHLNPGEEREVSIPIAATDLRFLSDDMRWVTEPGAYRVMVGASSRDIRLRGELIVR